MDGNTDSRPIGAPVDCAPARQPGPVELRGRFCRVEKLDPARHADDLWQAVGDQALWLYLSTGPFADSASFRQWLGTRAGLADPYTYVIVDGESGQAAGMVALMAIRPEMRVVEMGSIVYGPALQRTAAASEAQYLIARYVFEDLGYRRYEWKCNALHAGSRGAAIRLGFTFEGIFRQHMIAKGRNRDTAWFAMLDSEWPARRAALERWLAPANFDGSGRQRLSLADCAAGSLDS